MKQQKQLVGQLQNETMQDYIKYLTFLKLGPNRELDEAFKKYYETTNAASPMWFVLADKNQWVERAVAHDLAAKSPLN